MARSATALDELFGQERGAPTRPELNGRDDGSEVRLVDAAYWMKGCSSLGFLRYAALVRIVEPGGRRSIALVDLKEAVEAAAPAAPDADMPADPAERVVAGARALSPNLGERMLPVRLLGKPVVMRELPRRTSSSTSTSSAAKRRCGRRITSPSSSARPTAGRWTSGLAGRGAPRVLEGAAGGAEAPSWLWSSVVELAGRHEVGYLRHCRRYADRAAA